MIAAKSAIGNRLIVEFTKQFRSTHSAPFILHLRMLVAIMVAAQQ
jgi:hypothetical protein